MFTVEMKKKLLTKHSTFRLKEKQEERGSVQTLINIPLRSMLINGGTRDFDLFVFYHLTNRIRILRILKSNAHGKMTWHAAVSSY
jgi:hypothetical protein